MQIFSSMDPAGERKEGALWPLFAAGALASAIFAVDSFSSLDIAIAVLYCVVVLIAAPAATGRGVAVIAASCATLTVVGYLLGHAGEPAGVALLRCFVSLVALGLTTLLTLRMKDALAAMANSERRYRTIFESTEAGLWEEDYSRVASALAAAGCKSSADFDGLAAKDPRMVLDMMRHVRTVDVNDAAVRLTGARDKSQLTNSPGDLFGPGSMDMIKGILTALVERRPSYQGEGELRRFDGTHRAVLVSARFGSYAGVDRVFVSVIDITERRLAEEALRQAKDELAHVTRVSTLGELVASLAHEVSQPLAAVVTNGEACLRWLDRPEPDLPEARACASGVIAAGQRAGDVVRRLRAMVRRGPTEWEPLNMNQVVQESAALLDIEMKGQGVTPVFDLHADIPIIVGDRVQLQQVLVNLMLNAMQAMAGRTRKHLHLESKNDRDGTLVRVRDQGPGLDVEAMARLFTPFFTTKSTGMGMGLAICRSIVTSHRGRIWAESHSGDGATFNIWLPRDGESSAMICNNDAHHGSPQSHI